MLSIENEEQQETAGRWEGEVLKGRWRKRKVGGHSYRG
jgi:hypothetical protein